MLEEQYREIRERVDAACRRAGRKPEEVTLIAVSKTKPAEMIQQVYHAGARDFGKTGCRNCWKRSRCCRETSAGI